MTHTSSGVDERLTQNLPERSFHLVLHGFANIRPVRKMAALCKAQEDLQLSGVVHSRAFSTETHDEDTSFVLTPDTSPVETPDTSSVEAQEVVALDGVVHSVAFCTETHDEDAMSVESPNTSSVETSDTSSVETPEISSVETPALDTSSVETPEISSVETPAPDTSSVETPEISSVETPAPETSPVETPETSSVETSDTLLAETPDTSSVKTQDMLSVESQDMLSVESQEELLLSGYPHSMAYCKETRSVLLCNCFSFTIEQFSHSSSSGLSKQPQKLLKLHEQYCIKNPISVQIASKMGFMFIGCESKKGIYVLDRNSLQLVKKFAQDMNRDFDYMVVDETECAVYASSINNDILTKFDYNSGLVMRELPVMSPRNILLKDDKLYLVCHIDDYSTSCVLVIDKHSLNIQSKFALSGWSWLGGLCLDERGDVCVTARNDSNHRIIYSLHDGGNIVGRVQLKEFDKYAYALDMVAAGKDFIILAQEPEEFFTLKRIRFTF